MKIKNLAFVKKVLKKSTKISGNISFTNYLTLIIKKLSTYVIKDDFEKIIEKNSFFKRSFHVSTFL